MNVLTYTHAIREFLTKIQKTEFELSREETEMACNFLKVWILQYNKMV